MKVDLFTRAIIVIRLGSKEFNSSSTNDGLIDETKLDKEEVALITKCGAVSIRVVRE